MSEKVENMGEASHETALLLGEFKKAIASLEKAVESQTEKSEQGRAKIYRDLETIRAEQSEVNGEIRHLKERLDKADPVLSEMNKWRERFNGMVAMLLFQGAILGGAVALFWKWLAVKLGIN